MFFFLPENASLADVPGLVRDLRAQVDLQFAERIGQAASTDGHRVLLIQATDIEAAPLAPSMQWPPRAKRSRRAIQTS